MKHFSPRTWKRALLSGKYKRAKHQLKSYDGYCCLGVYRDMVSGPEGDIDSSLDESCPPWLSGEDQDVLAHRNDRYETTPGVWSPDGPVISYINDVIIPRYDAQRKAAAK